MNFLYNFSTASVLFGLFLSFSIFVWFLTRKQRKIIFYPILKIIDKLPKSYPKIIFVMPPIIPVLAILALGLLVLFITISPRWITFSSSKEPGRRIHIIVDNTASMEASVSMNKLVDTFDQLSRRVSSVNIVTFSVLSSSEVFQFKDKESFLIKLKEDGYSRKSVKLGNYVSRILPKIKETDQIFVLSDGDRYSWGDFNWKALEGQMPIRLRSLKTDINDKSNVFFKNIVAENSESLISNRWNVTLSRTQNINNSSFKLSTYYKEKKLHDTAVKFESDQLETTVSVSIPLSNLIANEENIVLRWQVENLDSNSNIITVDDYYFQPVQVSLSKVLLLSLPYGELTLEDPSFHVEKTLEVLGFKIRRIDQSIRSNLKSFNDYPLWIVSGGREGMYSRWCPKEVGPNTQLILSPESTQVSYKELCKCVGYHSSEGEQSYNQLPIYCEDVNVRDQFVEILRAQGGKQIGGEIGKLTTSLAWSFKSAGSNLLVTTLPIRPSRMTGITYNNMPIILKFIIDYLGLSTGGKDKDKLDSKALNLNVPIGESQLVYQNTNQLPALLHISDANEQVLLDNQKEDATVEPLIDIAYWIVLIIFLVEAIYYFIKSYRARNTLIVFALLGFGAGELKAVELVTVGRPKISPKLAAVLKNEVEGRTSITFSNKINFHPSLNEKIYKNQ